MIKEKEEKEKRKKKRRDGMKEMGRWTKVNKKTKGKVQQRRIKIKHALTRQQVARYHL